MNKETEGESDGSEGNIKKTVLVLTSIFSAKSISVRS